MAAAANTTPRNSGSGESSAAVLNSPQSKRGTATPRGAGSPWTQVVRGAESESAPSSPSAINNSSPDWSLSKAVALPEDSAVSEAQPESCDDGGGNAGKKPVWNKPSNGALDVGPVMGAVSWPALSESTRASPKPVDSVKGHPDGSVSVLQGTGIASSTTTQKQVSTNNTNPSVMPNHVTPARQKSMKRVGGSSSGNVTVNGGFPQQPPPLAPVVDVSSNNAGKSGSAVPELSSRDHGHKESGQRGGFGSQSHGGNEHPQQRNSFRRSNSGPHPRGDGSYHHNYSGRRDQDRRNSEWNSPRSFNGRDAHMQPQRGVPRGFIQPPPHGSAPPYIPPPPVPVRHFGNPIVYPEVPSSVIYVSGPPDPLRGVPIVAPIPAHAMYFPVPDPQLHTKIVNQIEYYFSNENLIKDTFLRQNMDGQGWVDINLIAGFKKVKNLTENEDFILDAVRSSSSAVEVKERKLRKRDDWMRWIMPSSVQFPTVSSPQSVGKSSHEMLAANIQSMSIEDKTNKQGQIDAFLSRSSSGNLNSQSQPSSGEGMNQVIVQGASDDFISARSSSK